MPRLGGRACDGLHFDSEVEAPEVSSQKLSDAVLISRDGFVHDESFVEV